MSACAPAGSVMVGLTSLALLLAGCASDQSLDTDVLATIDGDPITRAEVEEVAGDRLGKLDHDYRRQRYDLVEAALDRAIRDRLVEIVAESRGMSVEELVASEVDSRAEVTDDEVEAWYDQNEAALGGRTLEELATPIRQLLANNKRGLALEELTDGVREEREVVIHLGPFRVDLNNEGAPAMGPEDAAVTLVEFSDFECPYCAQFYRTLKQLAENYSRSLRIVYRQFPIRTHPNAYGAAMASLCANDQGQFWAMHDAMFEDQDNLGAASLREKAEQIGLDLEQYDACLASDRHAEQIERDMREARRLGVDGTPGIFLNGIPLAVGAPAYSVVAQAIDEELGRSGAR